MSSWMTPEQNYHWRLSLELKLRRLHGDALQDFFSTVMERRHKSDFIRVRPYGALGDKGCDGYVLSSGQLYQCYGKVDGAALNVASTISKIVDDFAKARTNFESVMREWHFVHNIIDGLPSEVITSITGLRTDNPKYKFGLAGIEWFMGAVFALSEADIIEFLGPAATAEQTHGLDMDEVKELLADLFKNPKASIDEGNPHPVPLDKLHFNGLSDHWKFFIRTGSPNAAHVAEYFARHHNPEFEKIVARGFSEKYLSLKLQGLPPDAIMAELFHQTAGNGVVPPPRFVAVQAVVAYLFDSCDIFEDRPKEVALQ